MENKMIFSENERMVISKFWERRPEERRNIMDVMTDFNGAVDLLESMLQKGILVKVGKRFYKLSNKMIDYLLNAETYNSNEW